MKMSNVNPVGWFDIYVTDLERAKKFYSTVFELQLTDLPTEWGKQAFFPFDHSSANISGALVEKKDRKPSADSTVVYFETQDCTAEEKRVEAAGGKVLQPKTAIGDFGYIAILLDTEGNTIGLHSRQ